MLSGIWVPISVACFIAALGLELRSLRSAFSARIVALATLVFIGLLAQGVYLTGAATASRNLPIASPAEWLLVAAWGLAVVYLAAIFYWPTAPTGLVMLPIVLALIGLSAGASRAPFDLDPERTYFYWGALHGLVLVLALVAVCVGFVSGLMYLLQSYALKHARLSKGGFRLPSLEALERLNSRSLGLSTLLIATGFASGVALSINTHHGGTATALWTDPVVISSAAMLAWLVAAEIFRWVYPAARQGRKVAYLTLASFLFLMVTLISLTLVDTAHGLGGPSTKSTNTQPSAAAS
jgi:ABC-type uncharacterized transport system permease subunit